METLAEVNSPTPTRPHFVVTVETDRFEHRHVKPHFLNPCCFGEDFAAWLKTQLADLATEGFRFSEPIQEDYGWGLWVEHPEGKFWVALSYIGTGPTEQPAQWVVSVTSHAGPKLLKRFLGKPDRSVMEKLCARVRKALEGAEGIRIIEPQGAASGNC